MVHTTRVAAAAVTLVALTGCGGAALDATPSHVYSPLPSLSTATPTPAPRKSVAPRPSPSPSPTPSAESTAGPEAGTSSAGSPAPVAAPEAVPAPVPAPGTLPDPAPGAAAAYRPAPAPVPGPPAAAGPVQVTQRTTSSTTAVTSTTVEGGVRILVTCEGRCTPEDLSAPELTGADGPISADLLQELLAGELSAQGSGSPLLTGDLAGQLTQGQWELVDTFVADGDEQLVFATVRP